MAPTPDEGELMEVDVERRAETWHVGKQIPIALIAAVLLQTAGLVWSIAGLYSRVDSLVVTVNEMKAERYTKEDGRRDRELTSMQTQSQNQRDNEQERRITLIESVVNQLQQRRNRE